MGPVTHKTETYASGKITMRLKRGKNKGKVRTRLVHRVAYEAFTGRRLVRKSSTRHMCNNSLCCNPEHMIGNSTQLKNNRDTAKSGRTRNQYSKKDGTGKKQIIRRTTSLETEGSDPSGAFGFAPEDMEAQLDRGQDSEYPFMG